MARILFVWELGGGLGHMSAILPAALEMQRRGHELAFALRDLSSAERLLGRHGFTLLQAPLWLAPVRGLPDPATYPEILLRSGFLDPLGLAGVVKAWRSIFAWIRPDLLLIDHAPSALLASRGLGIRGALTGNGFFVPPPLSPIPPFRVWDRVPAQRVAHSEDAALRCANEVLAGLGAPALPRLCDLFAVQENFLRCWPEFDHYARPEETVYWGPDILLDEGADAHWPAAASNEDKKIFAYLKADYVQIEAVLDALKTAPARTLVYAGRLPPALQKKYECAHLAFAPAPVRMRQVREQADLVICHAGGATVCAALQAGKPALCLPIHAEGRITAENAARLGASLCLSPQQASGDFKKAIKRLLSEALFTEQARQFALRYASYDVNAKAHEIAARCEELLRLPA
jgi:UDP:flavonoid glycosyltransferase YjiC (YdhE family)